jgi:hypothetical protein
VGTVEPEAEVDLVTFGRDLRMRLKTPVDDLRGHAERPPGRVLVLSRCWMRDCLMVCQGVVVARAGCTQTAVGRSAARVIRSRMAKRMVISAR